MSDGNTDDDMLHISNVPWGLAGAARALVHGRQRGAGMNGSVTRREGEERDTVSGGDERRRQKTGEGYKEKGSNKENDTH